LYTATNKLIGKNRFDRSSAAPTSDVDIRQTKGTIWSAVAGHRFGFFGLGRIKAASQPYVAV
jgi:hypothetical protein